MAGEEDVDEYNIEGFWHTKIPLRQEETWKDL